MTGHRREKSSRRRQVTPPSRKKPLTKIFLPALALTAAAAVAVGVGAPWSGTARTAASTPGTPGTASVAMQARDHAADRASRSRVTADLDLPPIPRTLGELKKAAQQARTRLATATAEWEGAKHALTVNEARLENLTERVDDVSARARTGRERLGRIAADVYKQPDAGLAVVLDQDEVHDFLRGSSTLGQVTRVQGVEVSRLVEQQRQAERLAEQSRGLSSQITTDAAALAQRRRELQAYAAAVQKRLDAALARLEARRLAANPLAGIPGCDPRPGYEDYPNGLVPADALCPLPQQGHSLRADAAAAFHRLNDAYRQRFGDDICVTDSYRSLDQQRALYARKPGLAAVPGTSNHGYGVAVDLCDGAESYGTTVHEWLDAYGDRYGWDLPDWARDGGGREEPWHWEYSG